MVDLSLNNSVIQTYIVYASLLCMKMLLMSILTARQRFAKKVFANPEDGKGFQGKVKYDDPDVERVRRAHLNDLENITVFLIISFLYILTNPVAGFAKTLIRAAAVGRIAHTFVYAVVPLPQPARALAWAVPYFISWYMGFNVFVYFMAAL